MTQIVDRARHERVSAIKDQLRAVDQSVARALWDWGRLLGEVERESLWRDDGAASFTEWLEEELDVSRRSAVRAITVARHFSADMVERFGTRKLAATVTYLELTAQEEEAGDILALEIRVRGESGRFVGVPYPEASARQIEDACGDLRAVEKGKVEKARLRDLGAEVRARASSLAKALPDAPSGTVRGDRVSVKKGKDGRMAVTIQGIPLDDLDTAIEAVRKHLAG